MKQTRDTKTARRSHRDSYARRTARIMAHMAKDGETEELAELKASLAQYFMEGPGKASGVTCLYFVEEGQRSVVGIAGAGVRMRAVTEPSLAPTERPPARRACLWSTWPGTGASVRTCWG